MKNVWICFLSVLISGHVAAGARAADHLQPAPVTLNALLEPHPTVRVIAKLLPEFESETGINVNIEVIPFEQMTNKARETLNRKSDRYDVYMDGWVNAIEWASRGHLEPLDAYVENPDGSDSIDMDDFIEAYISDARYGGKLFGLPVYGESTFFYFRKDLFSQYGIEPPETMEDIRLAARRFHKKNKNIYAITLRGREGVHIVYSWASFLWAFGGRWLDENGRADLHTPEAVQATVFFTDLLRNYGPPAVGTFGWEENRDLFLRGKAAMSIDATVNGAFNENTEISAVAGKVGYAPTPQYSRTKLKGGQSCLITHQMYVSKYSKRKTAAFRFISWATSKHIQLKSIRIEPNCGMTSKCAINSPIFQEKFGAFKQSMLEALENGNSDYLPIIPEAPVVFQKVGKALSNVIRGDEGAEAALERVNHEINAILADEKSL